MRAIMRVSVWLAVMAVGFAGIACAQKTPPPAPTSGSPLVNYKPPDWLKITRAADVASTTNSGDAASRLSAQYEAIESLANAKKLVAVLQLPCDVAAAARLGYVKSNADAHTAATKDRADAKAAADGKPPGGKADEVTVFGKVPEVTGIYEVACQEGTGYLLVALGPDKQPLAVSCVAADAAFSTDTAQGVKSEFYCDLPANKDVKAMATKLMSVADTPCIVSKMHGMGVDEATQTEYSEVACEDGKGYLMKTPMRLNAHISAISCREAVVSGLKCLLTDGGPAPAVTMQMLLDALKRNGVNCEPDQMRYIGRETVGKRYVVEVLSPERPKGLVSFIPVQDTTKPFETIDCATAAARNIQCKQTPR